MKKILAFLVALTAAFVLAAQEAPGVTPISEIDLLVDETVRFIPAGPLLTGMSVEEGEEFLEKAFPVLLDVVFHAMWFSTNLIKIRNFET